MKKLVMATMVALTMAGLVWANGQQESSGGSMSNNSMSNNTMAKGSMTGSSQGSMSSSDMMKSDTMKSGGSMSNSMSNGSSTFYDLSGMTPEVVPFTTQAAAEAMAKDHTVIYFFAASWCPTCQATYKNLKAHYQDIPDNVRLVVVNYDTATALKTKYGITQQHTFVEIDSQGNQKKIWSGTTTVQSILARA